MAIVTPDHRHGWWDKKTGEHGWYSEDAESAWDRPVHYTSCKELFSAERGEGGA